MKRTILVVDDSATNLSMLNENLKDRYKVIVAKNGSKALDILQSNPDIDLVLLDVVMPEMDGYEVCRRIKKNEATENIPIIFLTALNEISDEEKGLQLGAVDYITKPFSPPIVRARVETQISLLEKQERLEDTLVDLESRNTFIQKTFGQYLSDQVVSQILEQKEGVQLGGEERKVTILLSDLRGFTSICEGLKPEEIVWVVNCYLESMTEVIQKYQGTIMEFIGDAVLAIFGAPIAAEDDALRAMACSLEMQHAMKKVNEKCQEQGYDSLHMGIGLHTGKVVVGNIGSNSRLKYGIVGHNVNLVSRVESFTIGGQTLISESTYKEFQEEVVVGKSIVVSPKGVREPMTIYELEELKGTYTLAKDKATYELKDLPAPLKMDIDILAGKQSSSVNFEGMLLRINEASQAEIEAESSITHLSDIRIALRDNEGNILKDNLYAKKVDDYQEGSKIVHCIQFSVMSDELLSQILQKKAS